MSASRARSTASSIVSAACARERFEVVLRSRRRTRRAGVRRPAAGRARATRRARPRACRTGGHPRSGRASGRSRLRSAPVRRPRGSARQRPATASRTTLDVVAVEDVTPRCRSPSARSATLGDARHRAAVCELGVDVVLADEQDGEVPDRREVRRLVEGALVDRALAEECDRDSVLRRAACSTGRRRRRAGCSRRRSRSRQGFRGAGSATCIDPPLPRQSPVTFANSSAIIPSTSAPLARQWPCPRCVVAR